MKKEKNSFISNPLLMVSFIIFEAITVIMFTLFLLFGLKELDGFLKIFTLIVFVASILLVFFLFKKFIYKLKFDSNFMYKIKGKKVLETYELDKLEFVFINPKYGYVNIIGVTIDGAAKTLSFEYSKKRGELIKKYYHQEIKNLPKQFND